MAMVLAALEIAWRELYANPLRSSLTTLAIAIGAAALVCVTTISHSVSVQLSAELASLGSNLLSVHTYRPKRLQSARNPSLRPLTLGDATAIKRNVAAALLVVPTSTFTLSVSHGGRTRSTTVTGTTADFFTLRDWAVAEGRPISASDVTGARRICVVGNTVREQLFGSQRAVGAVLRIGELACRVEGVLRKKGHSVVSSDQDDVVLMPLTTMHERIQNSRRVHEIWVSAANVNEIEAVTAQIEAVLREHRHLRNGFMDFRVFDMREVAKQLDGITSTASVTLWAITGVSLLVGGIGVMSMMFATVAQRTREIGIRMAIGAKSDEILLQFLSEAGLVSTIGAVSGTAFGLGATAAVCSAAGMPFDPNPRIVAAVIGLCVAMGVGFALAPAWFAARLTPTEALAKE